MLDFEFETIMDKWSEKYNILIEDSVRTAMVKLHNLFEKQKPELYRGFDTMCEHYVMEAYYNTKYPNLGLYELLYAPWSLN